MTGLNSATLFVLIALILLIESVLSYTSTRRTCFYNSGEEIEELMRKMRPNKRVLRPEQYAFRASRSEA
jgi:hypothetical protein